MKNRLLNAALEIAVFNNYLYYELYKVVSAKDIPTFAAILCHLLKPDDMVLNKFLETNRTLYFLTANSNLELIIECYNNMSLPLGYYESFERLKNTYEPIINISSNLAFDLYRKNFFPTRINVVNNVAKIDINFSDYEYATLVIDFTSNVLGSRVAKIKYSSLPTKQNFILIDILRTSGFNVVF